METLLTAEQIAALMGRLNPSRVKQRGQGGRQLSYVEAWDIKATLIRMFGFLNFSTETIATVIVDKTLRPRPNAADGTALKPVWDVTAMCTVRLMIHSTGAVYTESAASMQSNPELGEALDFAIKTAESDALKRAAINLGTQFGLSLYDNGSTADVIRVLFDPDQKALWDSTRPAPTAEQTARIAESLGVDGTPAQVVDPSDAQDRAEADAAAAAADDSQATDPPAGVGG